MDFSNVTVLVIGDVMLDRYVSGSVKRISPEAPIPIVHVMDKWSVPGGAANVARNIARLGLKVKLIGMCGDDDFGDLLRKLLSDEKIDDLLICSKNMSTICKTRIIAQNQQLLRFDEENVNSLNDDDFDILQAKIIEELKICQVIILSDYGKGMLLEKQKKCLCQVVISKAKELSIPVIVDPKGLNWDRYKNANCITPNTNEFLFVCGVNDVETDNNIEQLAQQLRTKYNFENILLTRGAKGMALCGDNGVEYIKAESREVADVSGAGDTVVATLAACIAKNYSWSESSKIANIAAGIVVGKVGTASITINELNQALNEIDNNPKLFLKESLIEKINEWRHKNEKIVFTNGCFDLLHPGHVSILRQCASLGDKLIVGLNSDLSVKRLKGESRPIQDEKSRAQLLSALADVDAIIIFDEDTPINLINFIRPDILVKGGDYTPESIVGADFVKSYGGKVHIAKFVDGCSTTNIVNRLSS